MNKEDVKLAKKKILKCLTSDFDYGLTKNGKPLKRRKKNHGVFFKNSGYALYSETTLEMVMDAVMLGLYLAMAEANLEKDTGK